MCIWVFGYLDYDMYENVCVCGDGIYVHVRVMVYVCVHVPGSCLSHLVCCLV